MTPRRPLLLAAAGFLGLAGGPLVAPARADAEALDRRVQVGDPVEDVELRTIEGKRDRLLAKGARANVFVFFRPQQDRSLDTLKDLAGCEKELAGKPVRFVGVVSDSWPAEEVKAFVREAGVRMPILVDEGDALYGKLGIRLHPVVGIVDAKRKLAAFEPFRQINYCERVKVRIRLALGEATEADVARVDQPERATTRTDGGVARRHLIFARTLLRIEQHGKALDEVQKSLAIAPSADAWALEGEILAAQGRCPDALRAFEEALKLEAGNAVAQHGRTKCGR
jgi:tetratricopeptide (TPR) repeat protein